MLADGDAECAVKRVGSEIGGVELAWAQTAQFGGDLARTDARRVEQLHSPHKRYGSASGSGRGTTPFGVEAGVGDPLLLERDREADLVTARASANRDTGGVGRRSAVSLRRGQMMFERCRVHPRRG